MIDLPQAGEAVRDPLFVVLGLLVLGLLANYLFLEDIRWAERVSG
jgi:hypothetical protein